MWATKSVDGGALTVGENIGVGIAAAGLIVSILGILAALAYRMGGMNKQTEQNTIDIRDIRLTALADVKDIKTNSNAILTKITDVCDRTSRIEERIKKE